MALFKVALLAMAAAVCALAEKSPAEIYGHANSDVLETVDVTGDGGVVKLVLKRGDGPVPNKGQKINAHCGFAELLYSSPVGYSLSTEWPSQTTGA